MNVIDKNPFRVLTIVFFYCFATLAISSCGQYDDPSPKSNTQESSKDAYARMLDTFDCSTLNATTLNTTYRNRSITRYGSAIGPWYDNLKTAYQTNPGAYTFNPSYQKIYQWTGLILGAIKNGAKDLAESYCIANTTTCNNQEFETLDLRYAIEVYLQPLRTSLLIDPSFTQFDKDVLNNVIQVYYDNFEEITNYAIDGIDCFPDPSWYATGGISPLGFFSGIGKAIRKVVNIAATILTAVVESAVYGALLGAIIGVPFGVSMPGVIVGAVVGGVIGIVDGVNRCIAGQYVCILSCS